MAILGMIFVCAAWFFGLIFVARLAFPVPDPAAGSQQIAQFYLEHQAQILIACFFILCGTALLGPWGAVIAAMTRRVESGLPIWTYTQVACTAFAVFDLSMAAMFWALAAYRAGEQHADITQMLNDVAWFFALIPFQPYTVWLIAIAVPVLRATPDDANPTLPRWSAYLSLLAGFVFVLDGLMMFFKSGPLAYNGFLAFYVPYFVFGLWIVLMTVAIVQGLRLYSRGEDLEAATADV
ncbi:MAG: hypothetical protein AB7G47_08550 [Mycolicibacterium sp.]|uniref:hypothetical protein n=1 Tax=Mycolicibacterium sp. TaxID=2320850 RepID=UPI003D0CA5B5